MFHSFANAEPKRKRHHLHKKRKFNGEPLKEPELKQVPYVRNHLQNKSDFSDLFHAAIMSIQEDHKKCQANFNELALNYIDEDSTMTSTDRKILDHIVSRIFGYSMAELIDKTEDKLKDMLSESNTVSSNE
jgi:hypothetical protein